MQSFEVEVKSLLGSSERAEALRQKMKQLDPACGLLSRNKQLNHYFVGGNLDALLGALSEHLSPEGKAKLKDLASRAQNFSVRTRDKDGDVLVVVKASVDDTSSSNGISRIEFEERVDMTLDALDALLVFAGFEYQAKWSREREEYQCKGVSVCLDKNAGYGWLAEFEKVVQSDTELEGARQEVRQLMQECGIEELPQPRLERMFAFYNAHWPQYYGTDNIFLID